MGLEKAEIVDAVGIENESGAIVLTIFDAWDWSDERSHLFALQSKLNAYYNFIESGQLQELYPSATGRKVAIDLIPRYPLSAVGAKLMKTAATFSRDLGIELRIQNPESGNQ